jgi:hypothetical protein
MSLEQHANAGIGLSHRYSPVCLCGANVNCGFVRVVIADSMVRRQIILIGQQQLLYYSS